MSIEKTPSEKVREFILSKQRNETFSYDSLLEYTKKLKMCKLMLDYICLDLITKDLLEVEEKGQKLAANTENLRWAWEMSLSIFDSEKGELHNYYSDMKEKSLRGEINHSEIRERVRKEYKKSNVYK